MLNELDRRLLTLLCENARMSTSELARKLGLARSTIQGRIQKLEQEGVIKGYTVEYDDEYKKRLLSAQVLIKVTPKHSVKTNLDLKNIPQITALYAISGDYDMIAMVNTHSTEELSRTLDQIGHLPGVERTNSSLILEVKFSR